MDGHRPLRHRQFNDGRAHPHVERGADRADHGGPGFDIERALAIMGDIEGGFTLDDAHLPAVRREAHFGFAVAVEVQSGPVVQRDIAIFADAGLIAVDAAEGPHGNDGCDQEEQDRDGGGDHDVARQAALLLIADDCGKRG